METGKIVRWDMGRGFGFVHFRDRSEDAFLHRSTLTKDREPIDLLNRYVACEVIDTERGPRVTIAALVEADGNR